MKRFFHRLLPMFLILTLLASPLAGCASPIETPTETPDTESTLIPSKETEPVSLAGYPLTLPWYRGEGYNPYLTDNTLTIQLADLLFEKLVVIDPVGKLEYRAVNDVAIDGLTVTLTVDKTRRYADGSTVTPADVAASLNAARTSRLYKGRFEHVTAVRSGEFSVVITLREPDALFAQLLDIPVMPAGDVALEKPTASGAYTYAANEDALVPNPASDAAAPFARIELCEMTGADALAQSLNIGAISLYSSENEGLANGINSSRQAGFHTSRLVFLGFNSIAWRSWETVNELGEVLYHTEPTGVHPLLSTAEGRSAVNSLLARATLLEKVYYNQGHIATGYLDTVGPAGGHGTLASDADQDAAAALLTSLGCTMQPDGYWHWKDARADEPITLRLLVYSGSSYKRYLAQLIESSLQAGGLKVALDTCDDLDTYLQKIATLDFDMYIGEIKLYNNMDMSAFLAEGGAANAGLTLSEELLGTYSAWRADTGHTAALESRLAAEMPWAPLLWRSGSLYYAKELEGFTPSVSSVFYGLGAVRLTGQDTEADTAS